MSPPCPCPRLPLRPCPVPVPLDDSAEAMAALIDANTRALYVETIGNPAVRHDITQYRHKKGMPLIYKAWRRKPFSYQSVSNPE